MNRQIVNQPCREVNDGRFNGLKDLLRRYRVPRAEAEIPTAVLLVNCPDRKGIVVAVAKFLFERGANILHADQHQDNKLGLFFMRIEWDLRDFSLDPVTFRLRFTDLAGEFEMNWEVHYTRELPAVALFTSRHLHCLVDLLHRFSIGEMRCTIPLIISNHPDARPIAEFHGVDFHCIPLEGSRKSEAEELQVKLLEQKKIDVIALARYMQILSPEFVARYPHQIINVHHSFLPAFSGSRPYVGAFERGVKMIGATSHYVTNDLDEGPIIEQDVVRISHRDQLENLVQKGRDMERIVLARAIRWHLDHRILCYKNKTVVFD
jgi:formyltetrahydrofolate deformylase